MSKLDEALKKVQDLKKQLEDLTRKPVTIINEASINNLDQANEAINLLNSTLTQTKRQQAELESGFGGINEELRGIVSEMSRVNSASSIASQNFRGVQSIVEKLKYDQQGLANLNEKELNSLQKKLKQKQQEVTDQAKLVQLQYQSIAYDEIGRAHV